MKMKKVLAFVAAMSMIGVMGVNSFVAEAEENSFTVEIPYTYFSVLNPVGEPLESGWEKSLSARGTVINECTNGTVTSINGGCTVCDKNEFLESITVENVRPGVLTIKGTSGEVASSPGNDDPHWNVYCFGSNAGATFTATVYIDENGNITQKEQLDSSSAEINTGVYDGMFHPNDSNVHAYIIIKSQSEKLTDIEVNISNTNYTHVSQVVFSGNVETDTLTFEGDDGFGKNSYTLEFKDGKIYLTTKCIELGSPWSIPEFNKLEFSKDYTPIETTPTTTTTTTTTQSTKPTTTTKTTSATTKTTTKITDTTTVKIPETTANNYNSSNAGTSNSPSTSDKMALSAIAGAAVIIAGAVVFSKKKK